MKIFLRFNIIGISEGIYLAKSMLKKCMFYHYWFFHHAFEFQDYVCNGCPDLTMLSVNTSNIAITTIKNIYFC